MIQPTGKGISRRSVNKAILLGPLMFTRIGRTSAVRTSLLVVSPPLSTFEPASVASDHEAMVINNLFEPLTMRHPTLGRRPAQAAHWDVSEDGLVYTFHLRENLAWSDGVPLVADDFAETIRRVASPNSVSSRFSLISIILNANRVKQGLAHVDELGVRAIDDKTLEITLWFPCSRFILYTDDTVFMPTPRHTTHSSNDALGEVSSVVSNGAFVLRRRIREGIELSKNPHYHSAIRSNFDRVTVKFSKVTPEVLQKFHSASVDVLISAKCQHFQTVALLDAVRLLPHTSTSTKFLSFNLHHHALGDLGVRRALVASTDVGELASSIERPKLRAAGSFVPAHLLPQGWEAPAPVLALETLEQAMDRLGLNRPLQLRGSIPADDSDRHQIITAIQSAWRRLGVEVEFDTLPRHAWVESYMQGSADFFISSWKSKDHPSLFLQPFSDPFYKDVLGWKNDHFTTLFTRVCNISNSDVENRELYTRLEGILRQELPVYPLYHYKTFSAVSGRVQVDASIAYPTDFKNIRLRMGEYQ